MSLAGADLAALDATGQAELVRRGELTALELVDAAIARVERLNPRLNAVVSTCFERARDRARGGPSGPFAGVPYLLKDLIVEEEGLPFTEGSVWLRGHVSGFTSTLVTRLRAAGLVVLGRTNTPEFGMAPTCEPVLHGPTRNPWDLTRSTSGSSGGSAAAVASGMVPMAHGNDLGGSLRFPASACGLFGFKPTRGRQPLGPGVRRRGGWLGCRTRPHRLCAGQRGAAGRHVRAGAGRPLSGAVGRAAVRRGGPGRIPGGCASRSARAPPAAGWVTRTAWPHSTTPSRCASSWGTSWSRPTSPASTRAVGHAIATVFDAATAWIVAYWTRRLGRPPGPGELEPLTRAYLERGRRVTAADYLLAVEDLQAFSRTVAGFLAGYDAWLTPTMSAPAPPLGEVVSTEQEPLRAAQRGGATVAYPAVVANITGGPAMSVPLWQTAAGLPVGVHFLGRVGADATLFRLAGQLERARPWTGRRPRVHAQAP